MKLVNLAVSMFCLISAGVLYSKGKYDESNFHMGLAIINLISATR